MTIEESHDSNASSIPVSVVTGASEGIGRAYAFEVSACLSGITCVSMDFYASIHFCIGPQACEKVFTLFFLFFFFNWLLQLAERGMDVVIMSRTKEALDQVAKKISKYLISVYGSFFDFGHFWIPTFLNNKIS